MKITEVITKDFVKLLKDTHKDMQEKHCSFLRRITVDCLLFFFLLALILTYILLMIIVTPFFVIDVIAEKILTLRQERKERKEPIKEIIE